MSAKTNNDDIDCIRGFMLKNSIIITMSELNFIHKDLVPVYLKIRNKTYTIQINDEYEDLKFDNDILNFILVFRELSIIQDSSDFLHWCKLNSIEANNMELLSYYQNICGVMEDIRSCFLNSKINYIISDLDFQLNSGAMQLLRK